MYMLLVQLIHMSHRGFPAVFLDSFMLLNMYQDPSKYTILIIIPISCKGFFYVDTAGLWLAQVVLRCEYSTTLYIYTYTNRKGACAHVWGERGLICAHLKSITYACDSYHVMIRCARHLKLSRAHVIVITFAREGITCAREKFFFTLSPRW